MSDLALFFESILSVLSMLITLVVNFVRGVVQLISILPTALTMLSYSVSALPPMIVVFATAFISVSVVYLVIGR